MPELEKRLEDFLGYLNRNSNFQVSTVFDPRHERLTKLIGEDPSSVGINGDSLIFPEVAFYKGTEESLDNLDFVLDYIIINGKIWPIEVKSSSNKNQKNIANKKLLKARGKIEMYVPQVQIKPLLIMGLDTDRFSYRTLTNWRDESFYWRSRYFP